MLGETEMREKYQKDARFRAYVDRYASGYQSGGRISVEEALRHRIVRLVAEEGEKEGEDG